MGCSDIDRYVLSACITSCTWFPRVSVNLILVWGVISHLLATAQLPPIPGFLLACMGVFFGICAVVAYIRIVHLGPGSPADFPELLGDEEGGVPDILRSSIQTKYNGGYRYCSKCVGWKPDRTHHCSRCHQCILRMDHHCPWFSTCIGFSNHKYFVQFLWYITGLCFTAVITSVPILVNFFRNRLYEEEFIGINFVVYFVMAAVMGLCMAVFAAYTTYIMAGNATTLERMERGALRTKLPPSKFRYRAAPTADSVGNPFDIGTTANCEQYLGKTWKQWLLPIAPTLPTGINGVSWPTNSSVLHRAEAAAEAELAMHQRKREWERMSTV